MKLIQSSPFFPHCIMTEMIQVPPMATGSLDIPENGQASKKAKHRQRMKQQRQCPQLSSRLLCPFFQSLPCGSSKFTLLSAVGDDVEVINLSEDVLDFGKLIWAGFYEIPHSNYFTLQQGSI